MNKKIKTFILSCFILLSISFQIDDSMYKNENSFVSDTKYYRLELDKKNQIEFNSVFYGNNTYRIAIRDEKNQDNLKFSVYDIDNNLLFSNKNLENKLYWNFYFSSTIQCKIIAKSDNFFNYSKFAIIEIDLKIEKSF